jgi:hypothetical protein
MTRKERINKLANKISDKIGQECFFWSNGIFSYWETYDVIENSINDQKFFFCTSDGNSITPAFKKNNEGNYWMSSMEFTKKVKEFEEWLVIQANKVSRTL